MSEQGRFDVQKLWTDYGIKLLRYGGVTIVTTVVGLTTLFVGLEVFDWQEVLANFVSVLVSTPFGYYLNRSWVWERDAGNHSATGEVGPFWIMTFLGFVVSTIAVWVVGSFVDSTMIILLTQIASFAALWLVKFYFLEKYLWSNDPTTVTERV